MTRLLDIKTQPLLASRRHAVATSLIQKVCLPSFWSVDDVLKMLKLPNIGGFFSKKLVLNPNSGENHKEFKINGNSIRFSGLVLFSSVFDEMEILKICVLPEFRRIGLATKLMGEVVREGNNRGIEKMFLEVSENNTIARKFYISHGFYELSRRKKYYKSSDKPMDAIIYTKLL